MTAPFTHDNIVEIFGTDAADTEDAARLYTFFVANSSYDEVRAPHPVSLIVGQKGIGKTALMRVSSLDDARDQFPHVFMKAYQILGETPIEDASSLSLQKFKSAIESAIVEHVVELISKAAATSVGVPEKVGSVVSILARIGASVASSQSSILKEATQKTVPWLLTKFNSLNIYIDDTDVDWDGSKRAAARIAKLIQACFQISAESDGEIRFKLSLRSDLFNYLSVTADIIDKVQGGIIRCRWTNDDIFRVLAKRIALYSNVPYEELDEIHFHEQEVVFQKYFLPFFEPRFHGQGVWANQPIRQVIMSFVRQRPRDLIGFCRLAAKVAERNGTKIDTDALNEVIPEYSTARFNDTVVEFSNEFPEVERFLYEMRATDKISARRSSPSRRKRNFYKHDELISKITEIGNRVPLRFSYKSMQARAPEMVEFMFRINFLVATREDETGYVERMYYDFADTRLRETRLGKWDWEVHMAYRWAIQHDEQAVWESLHD